MKQKRNNYSAFDGMIKEIYQIGFHDGYAELFNEDYVGEDTTKKVEIQGIDKTILQIRKKYFKTISNDSSISK